MIVYVINLIANGKLLPVTDGLVGFTSTAQFDLREEDVKKICDVIKITPLIKFKLSIPLQETR